MKHATPKPEWAQGTREQAWKEGYEQGVKDVIAKLREKDPWPGSDTGANWIADQFDLPRT